ncbi:MAG: VWA domain-containing protein [Planctomycetota bacterium]|nr:VWA domain-containing protein [Planctomycetota bacterium]
MVRQARQTRPQVVCILADDSASLAGAKAQAATNGIREMIMECQSKGPPGPERSYFKLLLIRFDQQAAIDPQCDLTPVRKIDPDAIAIDGRGGQTNITAALQLALDRLRPYLASLQDHPERAMHPLPLVLVFSDGQHNAGAGPEPVAAEIKRLTLDGEPVVIAAAGVSVGGDQPDEQTLRNIASPECYVPISNVAALTAFIAAIGSSGASRAKDVAAIIQQQVQA